VQTWEELLKREEITYTNRVALRLYSQNASECKPKVDVPVKINKVYASSDSGRSVSPLYSTMACGGAAHAFDVFDLEHPRDVLVRALGLTENGFYASCPCVYAQTNVTLNFGNDIKNVHYMELIGDEPTRSIQSSKDTHKGLSTVTFSTALSFCCFAVQHGTTLSGHRLFRTKSGCVLVNDPLNVEHIDVISTTFENGNFTVTLS